MINATTFPTQPLVLQWRSGNAPTRIKITILRHFTLRRREAAFRKMQHAAAPFTLPQEARPHFAAADRVVGPGVERVWPRNHRGGVAVCAGARSVVA